jgi:transposase
MLTKMTEEDLLARARGVRCLPLAADKGRDDRKFLEALHYFTVHNITWRALPAEFGSWNSIWKRFWRMSPRSRGKRFQESFEHARRRDAESAGLHSI